MSCATSLEASAAPRETRKVVTVLFSDVTGSTSLGEQLDPESLRHVMGQFFDAMQGAVERHGGVVEKFIGDAVMAVFGIPRLHEDDPIRAVRAAADMQTALATLNEQLQAERGVSLAIRTGITTGEVVSGDPSAGQRLVTGDTVNTAARLEQNAAPGEILIGEPTYRLVRDAVDVEPARPLELKGKAEPVPAYRLVSVTAGADAHARRLDSPMVGRERELRLLTEALDGARSENTAHLFTLLGPAGVGKSRLVLEFLERAQADATILRGRCLSYGEGITFFPLSEVVHEAAGIQDDDSPDQARARIEQALAHTDQAPLIAQGLADLIGLADRPIGTEDATWAVRNFLEALATDRPVVVVFDDVHWAEPAFLDLIEHVADWSRDAPILLLCVARPELLDLRPGWGGGKMNAQSVLLEPLDTEHAAELVDNLLGSAAIPTTARTRILEAAEGNPLFVEEMLAMLVDDGLLTQQDGQWMASDEVERVAVPPTIQLLLAARLDRLDSEERAVAERASVEGKVFHRGAVMRMSPDRDRGQVGTRLLALARKELIRPDRATFAGEDAFRFRHLLIRDAAYQGMPKEARAELHEQFADWLAEQAGDRLAEYEDILGYHLEQAYLYRQELGRVDDQMRGLAVRAATALHGSARRARDKADLHGASRLLRRTVDLTAEGSPEQRARRYELMEVLRDMGEFREASTLADDLLREAQESGDRRIEALASAQRAYFSLMIDSSVTMESVLARATETLRTLQELGDARGVLSARWFEEGMLFALGRIEEAQASLRARLEEARGLGDLREMRESALALLGNLFWGSGRPTEILAEGEQLRLLVADSPSDTTRVLLRLPAAYAMLGRFEEARREAEHVREQLEQMGNPLNVSTGAQYLFRAHRLTGDWSAAEREMSESVAILEAMGEQGFLSTSLYLLAEAVLEQDRYEEAEQFAERSRALAVEDDHISQVGWRGVMAKVLASRGAFEEAERLAREGTVIVDGTGYLDAQGDAWLRLAEVLRMAGNTAGAAEAFTKALELCERKGNEVKADRIRAELADLGTSA